MSDSGLTPITLGALVNDNYLARNWNVALIYEISYNAMISQNTFADNAWGIGSYRAWGFPMSAVYLNGSGGSPAVDGGRYSTLTLEDNVFTDNWGGVVDYQNPDRVCGSPDNTSTGYCTLDSPSTYTTASCAAHDIGGQSATDRPDYFDGCQWKATRVLITGNRFSFTPQHIVDGLDTLPKIRNDRCRRTGLRCGFNGLFSIYGSVAPYRGWVISDALMGFGSDPDSNVFRANTYRGKRGRSRSTAEGTGSISNAHSRAGSPGKSVSGCGRACGRRTAARWSSGPGRLAAVADRGRPQAPRGRRRPRRIHGSRCIGPRDRRDVEWVGAGDHRPNSRCRFRRGFEIGNRPPGNYPVRGWAPGVRSPLTGPRMLMRGISAHGELRPSGSKIVETRLVIHAGRDFWSAHPRRGRKPSSWSS